MKVLFVVPRFHTNLFFATRALKRAGVGVHLFCAKTQGLEDHSEIEPAVFDQDKVTWSEVKRHLDAIDPDLVVIRQVGRLSKMIYWLSALERRAMVGYDQRPYLRPRHFGQILQGSLRGRPMRRLTPVHGLPAHGGRPDRFATYLPFPVEVTGASEPRLYAPEGVTRILCVGKLAERRKNHLLLLKALEPLAADFNFRVTIAGSSSLDLKTADRAYFETLMSYADRGALAERLRIRKDVSFEEMGRLYGEHDICVLPSSKEPLGTAPLEAMGRGCLAVISSDSGSAYYVDGAREAGCQCGFLFPTGDGEKLTGVMRGILQNPETIPFLGQNAMRWVVREFDPETFAARFLALAERLRATGPALRAKQAVAH